MCDDHPDWSPDGKRIAFERCAEGEPCEVFTVAADGGKPQKVHARCELGPICDLATPGVDARRATARHARPGTRTSRSRDRRAWIQQSAVELLDLDTGRQRTIVERRNWTGDAGTPAVSPDGAHRHLQALELVAQQAGRGPRRSSPSTSTARTTAV